MVIVSLTMYRLCSGSKHHVSSGCQIVFLQLSHQNTDHAGDLGVLPRLVMWSAGRTRTETIFFSSFEWWHTWGNAYFWRRTFVISAPIWASCTRGLQRSCLDRASSTAAISSGKLDWKNFNSNQAESSRICTLKQIFHCWLQTLLLTVRGNVEAPHLWNPLSKWSGRAVCLCRRNPTFPSVWHS